MCVLCACRDSALAIIVQWRTPCPILQKFYSTIWGYLSALTEPWQEALLSWYIFSRVMFHSNQLYLHLTMLVPKYHDIVSLPDPWLVTSTRYVYIQLIHVSYQVLDIYSPDPCFLPSTRYVYIHLIHVSYQVLDIYSPDPCFVPSTIHIFTWSMFRTKY